MRKILFVLVGIVLLFIAAAAILPFMIDVDKYRPQIVQLVNDKLNGKFELGKLKLSLWGQIRINVESVSLKDSKDQTVFAVKNSYLHLPFGSIFGGSPELTFKMNKPAVFVTRSKAGKLNVMNLLKPGPEPEKPVSASPAKETAVPTPQASTVSTPAQPIVIPGILARARLSVEMKNSTVSYRDEASDLITKIDRLDFLARDVSLARPTIIEIKAELDTRLGKELFVKGPLSLSGRAEPRLSGGQFDSAKLDLKAEFDSAEIKYAEFFYKKAGVPLRADMTGAVSPEEVKFDRLGFKFLNAEVVSKLQLINQGPKDNSQQLASPSVFFSLNSNSIELKPWAELVPMLKDFELGGAVQVSADAKGPLDRLVYGAKMELSSFSAKLPKFKSRPVINGTVLIKTDQIENFLITMKAPGNDLQIKGSMVSFASPRFDIAVNSTGMDLDQLLILKAAAAPAATPGSAPAAPGKSSASAKPTSPAQAAADFDALLTPLRVNPIAKAMSGVVNVSIQSVKAYDVAMTALKANLTLKELKFVLSDFGMKLYDGSVRATAAVALLPKTPTYQFSSQVFGLDLSKAVAAQFAMLKNTLIGKANFDFAGAGSSFNPEPAMQNLKGKGSLKVENAKFATIDVGKMATEGLNQSIEKISEKIPPLKGKKLGGGSNRELRYEVVSSDFTLDGGYFNAPNFVAKAAVNQGIDLKGRTKVGMKDFALDTDWEVIDTYNLLKAKDLAIEQQGVRVEHVLAEGNGPVKFPVHVGCTLTAPCYSYTQVPEYLGKVALGNLSQALTGKAKAELKKKADEVLKNAPAPVQKKLEELGKKFKLFN